jgi:hypothetical protein
MFAGRYLWWNAVAVMAYVFFAIYFYYVTWLAVRVSGCAAVVGSCGDLDTWLNGAARPIGLFACGIAMLVCGVLRIQFLKMSPLWHIAFLVWFLASADYFFTLGDLWHAQVDAPTMLAAMPIEALFLGVLIAFLSFPVELYKKSPSGALRVIHYVAGFTASYSFSFTIATSPKAVAYLKTMTHSEVAVAEFQLVQQKLKEIVSLGHDSLLPMVVALALFVASLSYLVVIRKAPGGAAPAAIAA